MSQARSIAALGCAALLFSSTTALAHPSFMDGPGIAGTNQVLNIGLSHGCEGADTISIEVAIPSEVTEVRALVGPAGFGEAALTINDAELVTAVKWTKTESRAADDQYYVYGLRISVPDMPFESLYFPTTQTCLTTDGEEVVVEWALTPEEAAEAGGDHAPTSPALKIVPKRGKGWNKFTVADKLEDLSIFDDAEIVWLDDKAYSSNETIKELIESDEDVDELTEIPADSEIWVKY
jgi:uncharacterized protein YcnI